MKSDVIIATCIVNILVFVWLLWILFVPQAQYTGWELFFWTLVWLPAAMLGLMAVITGFKMSYGHTLVGKQRTVVLALCWTTLVVNFIVIGLITKAFTA